MLATRGNIGGTVPMESFVWQDIIIVVDDGKTAVSEYGRLTATVNASEAFPNGFGLLSIIPESSSPPPEDVRKVISQILDSQGSRLRCVCWLVEPSGFRGASARAVLTGFRLFSRAHYPRHVSTNLEEALGWMMARLEGGDRRSRDIQSASTFIRGQRGAGG